MTEEVASAFLNGACAALAAVAALCLLRFWVETRDRLFALFAVAFAILTLNWALIALFRPTADLRHWYYLLRLAGFSVIIYAIVDRNRRTPER